MIDALRAQFNFGDKLIADEVDGLYEEWMVHVDQVLADEKIVAAAYEALAKRRLLSRTRGRRGFSAEVAALSDRPSASPVRSPTARSEPRAFGDNPSWRYCALSLRRCCRACVRS